jgi:hypothetical protein
MGCPGAMPGSPPGWGAGTSMSGAGVSISGGGAVGWPGWGAPGLSAGAGSGWAGMGGSTGMAVSLTRPPNAVAGAGLLRGLPPNPWVL